MAISRIAESAAIVDYIIRRYGKGAMMPAPGSAEYEAYNEWLHYSEGSAMLPLMLNLYVSRLKEAGAPLHPRIDSELANHLGYVDGALEGRDFFVGPSLTGADIQMSFVGEMAKVFGKLGAIPKSRRVVVANARSAGVQTLGREGRSVPVRELTLCVIPGCAGRRPGISRLSDAQLRIVDRCSAPPRNDDPRWPPWQIPAIPTISGINIRPSTATAWPSPCDVVSGTRHLPTATRDRPHPL